MSGGIPGAFLREIPEKIALGTSDGIPGSIRDFWNILKKFIM